MIIEVVLPSKIPDDTHHIAEYFICNQFHETFKSLIMLSKFYLNSIWKTCIEIE
jgi:hypothetical protein